MVLIHFCILGVVYPCALLLCARSIFGLCDPGVGGRTGAVPQAVTVGTEWHASVSG